MSGRVYLTVKQFCERHEWPSENGMRAYIFKREENGFRSAFLKVGRRVLVDEEEFFRCLEGLKDVPVTDVVSG